MNNTISTFKITDSQQNEYYGGDQSWYSSNTRAMAGCSSVAAANSLRSLCFADANCRKIISDSKTIPYPVKRALLSKDCNKEDYLMLMTLAYEVIRAFEIFPLNIIYDRKNRENKFFKYVKPNNGRSSIGFISGTLRLAKKLGLFLKCHPLPTAFCTKESAIRFIDEGLKNSGSVVLLTSYNKHSLKLFHFTMLNKLLDNSNPNSYTDCPCGEASMKCHFATIIGRRGEDVMISTWGRVATTTIDELVSSWHSIKAWESALFYFTPADRTTMRHNILTSWKPFFKGIVQAIFRKSFS